jgi:hypothetical protein
MYIWFYERLYEYTSGVLDLKPIFDTCKIHWVFAFGNIIMDYEAPIRNTIRIRYRHVKILKNSYPILTRYVI